MFLKDLSRYYWEMACQGWDGGRSGSRELAYAAAAITWAGDNDDLEWGDVKWR